VVGVLSFYKDSPDEVWTARETELLRRLVTQLGVALESAQLFEETQRRAAREQSIRQVTERMRSAVSVEDILQSAVTELARALGAPRAYVRLGTEAELLGARRVPPASGPARPHRPELVAGEQDNGDDSQLDTAAEQDQGDDKAV
jgi:GAF domain-containing protein